MAYGKSIRNSTALILFMTFLLILAGTWACSGAGEEASEETGTAEEAKLVYEGKVKLAVGKYVYVPEIQGFDVYIQGSLSSGDTASLIDKEVKVEGNYAPDRPSVLIADTLEIRNESGVYQNVFTRTEEVSFDDYIDQTTRDEFVVIEELRYNNNRAWEELEKAKVYGRIEGEEGSFRIAVLNEEEKEIGKLIVDSFTDFGQYYLQKLEHFDKYWFYVNVKDTVAWSTRRRTREMFHCDVVFVGLY